MRKKASAAVLEAVVEIFEIAAAFRTQRIQRAITEQAVEILYIVRFVTRKKLTFLVLKKFVVTRRHLFHFVPPCRSNRRLPQ